MPLKSGQSQQTKHIILKPITEDEGFCIDQDLIDNIEAIIKEKGIAMPYIDTEICAVIIAAFLNKYEYKYTQTLH